MERVSSRPSGLAPSTQPLCYGPHCTAQTFPTTWRSRPQRSWLEAKRCPPSRRAKRGAGGPSPPPPLPPAPHSSHSLRLRLSRRFLAHRVALVFPRDDHLLDFTHAPLPPSPVPLLRHLATQTDAAATADAFRDAALCFHPRLPRERKYPDGPPFFFACMLCKRPSAINPRKTSTGSAKSEPKGGESRRGPSDDKCTAEQQCGLAKCLPMHSYLESRQYLPIYFFPIIAGSRAAGRLQHHPM